MFGLHCNAAAGKFSKHIDSLVAGLPSLRDSEAQMPKDLANINLELSWIELIEIGVQ